MADTTEILQRLDDLERIQKVTNDKLVEVVEWQLARDTVTSPLQTSEAETLRAASLKEVTILRREVDHLRKLVDPKDE